jgi:hypothetical protein
MIRALFNHIVHSRDLEPLGLIPKSSTGPPPPSTASTARLFFEGFDEGHAVQYFYEPFLQAFDPELRKELGVWYTPPKSSLPGRARRRRPALRTRLADGLADPQVVVLDPCCGTGAYLCAVLRRIPTLHDKGGDALAAHDLKAPPCARLRLRNPARPLRHRPPAARPRTRNPRRAPRRPPNPPERAGVYLTNALTGWEPPKDPKRICSFPELMPRNATPPNKVKAEAPILVILGNPPYNAFAGVSPEEEERPRRTLQKRDSFPIGASRKFNLDDLYVRFFRLAEKRIAEHGGRGVVSFISNFSYLGDPVLRRDAPKPRGAF